MDIVVAGRHTEISDRFRTLVDDKLEKIAQLTPTAQRIDVLVVHERNPRMTDLAERVEITVTGKGPVVRAEASAADRNTALDLSLGKLSERLRRARDRRKDQYRRNGGMQADLINMDADALLPAITEDKTPEPVATLTKVGDVIETTLGDSPVVIREKLHAAVPLTVDDALYEMELVGHDFFLFVDAETAQPSVVYRRHGWSYGVIRLDAPVVTSSSSLG